MARQLRNVVNGRRRIFNSPVKGITTMGVVGAVLDGGTTAIFDQMENPENSTAWSIAKGTAVGAGWLFAEPLMWGITLGGLAKDGLSMAYDEAKENQSLERSINNRARAIGQDHRGNVQYGGTLGGSFEDNERSYTMRQRQMEIMRQHRIGMENILGSEARQLHR